MLKKKWEYHPKVLIEKYAGGVIGGWGKPSSYAGGSSMPLLSKKICDTITMDFDSLIENKSGLGTAGIVVINKDQDIVECMAKIARFYKHEKLWSMYSLSREIRMDVENIRQSSKRERSYLQ